MWRNFSFPCMTIVGKLKISPPVEKFLQLMGFCCNLCRFVAKSVIHAVLSRNFCHNLRAFMWRKIVPKSTFVEKKMTNIRSENRHNSLANFFWLHCRIRLYGSIFTCGNAGQLTTSRQRRCKWRQKLVWFHETSACTVGRRSRPPMLTANRKK